MAHFSTIKRIDQSYLSKGEKENEEKENIGAFSIDTDAFGMLTCKRINC